MMIANVPNNAGHQMNSRLYLRELNLIRLLFLFCGYDLCQGRKPQSRWVKIIRCLWKIVIYFTFTVVAVKEVVSCTLMLTTQMDITFDERLFRVCISLLQITLTVCYVDMALKNDKWQILFETLTAFVEAIHSSSVKVNVKMTIHHWSVGVVVITVLYTLATFIGIITCYEQSNYFYRDIPLKTALPTIMAYIAKICLLTPFTFVPFVMLLETIPIFLYYILCKLFEINPGENSAVVDKSKEHGWLSASWSKNRQFLGDFLEWHRQMCDLVRMVESVLSARMLWYTGVKAVFVIISVQYTSSVRQDQDLVYISFIFSNVFNVALIVAQTILASRVNEQVVILSYLSTNM